ncbi:MAG: helix-turn-helix domain-containing protein [Alphaproteobacteria bacterium]|nr:helix-turn-helix domain-containing protein [Alphaproteobacteria bacterium]
MKNSERLPDRDRARSIGELGKQTGTKVQTIRYYEQIGILPEPARTAGNQRSYSRAHADRLAFIRHSRELGFSLDAIRTLLDLSDDPNRSCEQADRIARHHLQDVNARIESLAVLKAELERMIRQCRRQKIADCRIIEVLADHTNCTTEDHHKRTVATVALRDLRLRNRF